MICQIRKLMLILFKTLVPRKVIDDYQHKSIPCLPCTLQGDIAPDVLESTNCADSDRVRLIAFYRAHLPVYGGKSGQHQRIHTPNNANPVRTFGELMRNFLRNRNHLRRNRR